MTDQCKLRRKLLKPYILIVLIAVILSGCGKNRGHSPQQFPAYGVLSGSGMFIREVCRRGLRAQERAWQSFINRNMPEIEVLQDFFVKVTIHNEAEYRAFVNCLEEYVDCYSLTLFLKETDTVIYLDEILAYQNFEFLRIMHGGTISARNMEALNTSPLRKIELYHPYAIEEDMLSRMPNLQDIIIRFNSWYSGVLPANELLHNTDCSKIVMRWDADRKEELNFEGLAEWDAINAMLPENDRYIKALYVQNEDDYNYISYEFCSRGGEIGNTGKAGACKAFICIKDRESYGEKYFDILEVPVENIEMSWHDGRRMWLVNINFDGYRDLIFVGYNDNDFLGGYHQCIGFLWNEKEQRYEWNATVPEYFDGIDAERKRIVYVGGLSASDDDYRIYEYNGSVFTEKRLEVTWPQESCCRIIWQYYEEGELLKRLEQNYDEDAKLYYITYEENGIVTEEVMEEADYDTKYGSYDELGMEYFPEFDFYWAG